MMKKMFVLVTIIIALLCSSVAYADTSKEYDTDTLFLILKYAGMYDLPVPLVYQVIKVESNFYSSAENKHYPYSDQGLMQLNSQYSYTFASEIGIREFDPMNDEHNIWVGCYHLSNIYKTQIKKGRVGASLVSATLTVYNAGGSYLRNRGIRIQYTKKFDIEAIVSN